MKCVGALFFCGGQGVGKETFSNTLMGSSFGKIVHFTHVVNADHVVDNFNSLLPMSLLVVLDKCIFPGNQSHAIILKSLLHDKQKVLRQLHKDAVVVASYDHLIINSNNQFCARLDKDDRSYACMSIKNYHQGDTVYWASVHNEIGSGGREAFLHHLMHDVDIEGFSPEQIPPSLDASWWSMKVHVLSDVDKFLLNVLQNPDEYIHRDYCERKFWFLSSRLAIQCTNWLLIVTSCLKHTSTRLRQIRDTRNKIH